MRVSRLTCGCPALFWTFGTDNDSQLKMTINFIFGGS